MSVRLRALRFACVIGIGLACSGDGPTDPVPEIAGSYTAETTIGDVTLHIEQRGRQLSGDGTFVDGEIITEVDLSGEIIDFNGGDRVIISLTAANFVPAFITLDFFSITGTIGGGMQRGTSPATAGILLIPVPESR